jgi:cytochrome c oxidase assembly protein subunit 15
MSGLPESRPSPWPRRLAIALALVTFPLIWVGGLVTTYDAGMAVPDWPGTYGYNLFLYPWQSWLAAPWDLFIEHGHRLLGAAAGIVAIALVAVTWKTDERRWIRMAALGALLLVMFQGALGGARVRFDERLVALVHGCVGPLFFAYLAGLIVAFTPEKRGVSRENSKIPLADASKLYRAAGFLVVLAVLQVVFGAIVRHLPLWASPGVFRAALVMHLVIAGAIVWQTPLASFRAWRTAGTSRFAAVLLPVLVILQIVLGAGTYVVKYAWPAWLADYQFAAAYVVREKSLAQSLVTTAHVAGGSLILFTSVYLATQATLLFRAAGWLPAHADGIFAWKVRAAT